jgi:hypothetical protein
MQTYPYMAFVTNDYRQHNDSLSVGQYEREQLRFQTVGRGVRRRRPAVVADQAEQHITQAVSLGTPK